MLETVDTRDVVVFDPNAAVVGGRAIIAGGLLVARELQQGSPRSLSLTLTVAVGR